MPLDGVRSFTTMCADLVVILGPTASGKTAAAIALARQIGGEIVSADSMQVYRGLDIGTAKPTQAEREAVPFHCLDLVDIGDQFTVVDFQREALRAVNDIRARGAMPILCGGTGFYIRAFLEGFSIAGIPSDPDVRDRLQHFAEEVGPEALHARLTEVDPVSARRIHSGDAFRIVRALEVFEAAGRPLSEIQRKEPLGFRSVKFGLSWDRAVLHSRIAQRAERMLQKGWVQETRDLLSKGCPAEKIATRVLGYRHLIAHLRGEITMDVALGLILRDTRRYAKRQMTWFRKEPEVNWIDADIGGPGVLERMLQLLHR